MGLALTAPRVGWPQGQPLGPEFRVNTYTTYYQGPPSVAADGAGNFVVVWAGYPEDGSTYAEIFGQRYASSGSPLGPEFRVNTSTTLSQAVPSVAADAAGNFVVVWESGDGSSGGIFGQRYDSSGTSLGPEFRVNTYTTEYQAVPTVARDGAGDFVVVWRSKTQDGSGVGVFGQRYASSGAPLGPEFRVNTYTTGAQRFPSVAFDPSGRFVVVWQSNAQDGSGYGVFGQRFASSGSPVGPEFRVNSSTTSRQEYPSVAASSSGNFVVVWQSLYQDGSDWGVFGQRFASSGAPAGPEFRLNTHTTGYQFTAALASDALGNFVVVWSSGPQDDASIGVFGQRYAGSGAPLGPEFRVNTYTTSYQGLPAVASDPAGHFVVVWISGAEDGSEAGVFGQRYSEVVPVELMRFGVE